MNNCYLSNDQQATIDRIDATSDDTTPEERLRLMKGALSVTRHSRGAIVENMRAKELRLPIYFTIADLQLDTSRQV